MKIGLLTFHDTNNWGSYLQTYGLYKKICDLGYECDVIDYQCESIRKREVPTSFTFTFNPKQLLLEILLKPAIRRKYRNLHDFLHKNMTLSEIVVRENVKCVSDKYDKFFVGSDIVWGMDIIAKDTTYFLDFIQDNNKKYAFASSIGNPWTDEDKLLIKPYLNTFKSIAVRENESADWVEELISKRPKVVCDPTMLIEPCEWVKLASDIYNGKKYVLVYFPTEANIKDAISYSKHHGISCYVINLSLPLKGVTNVNPVTMGDFLSLFLNATFVFTGSYHGMLFSIYFNREFAYYNRAHKSRMNTLAQKLGVLDRDGNENDVANMNPIDYNKVNEAVNSYRSYSIDVLKGMLSNEPGNM